MDIAISLGYNIPCKTPSSAEQNLIKIGQTTPLQLRNLSKLAHPNLTTTQKREQEEAQLRMRYQTAHLMANSDSERTLVATFDQKPTNKQTKLTCSIDVHGRAPQQSNR